MEMMKSLSSVKRMEPMSSMGSMEGTISSIESSGGKSLKCSVKCNKKCRPKLTDAVTKCGGLEKECILGQFSNEDKKSCNLKCS